MGDTYTVVVGEKGRVVVPADVRQRMGLAPGSRLVLVDSPQGLVLLTQAQLRDRVRAGLHGRELVGGLLDDRRQAARAEDAA